MLAALYFWFPKMTGRMMSESLGKVGFALMFVGFHLTFLIQHSAGLCGMPRRIYEYSETSGWTAYNFISTVGAFMIALERAADGHQPRPRAQEAARSPGPTRGRRTRSSGSRPRRRRRTTST